MTRAGHLFDRIASFENLLAAWEDARRGKAGKPGVTRFAFGLEHNLHRIRAELMDGSYRFGPYRVFQVCDTKPRRIVAAPFRDRVVHHAICRVIEPVIDPTLIADTFACRRGKGTLAAMRRVREFVRAVPRGYALRCDVRRYFASIDRETLVAMLARKLKDPRAIDLLRRLVDSAPLGEAGRGKGIPIGNLTSQVFANAYLSPVDHLVKEELRARRYARYVDDLVVVDASKERLWGVASAIGAALAGLGLKLHPRKLTVRPVTSGVDFVGYVVFPDTVRMRGANVLRFRRRERRLRCDVAAGRRTAADYWSSVDGWVGHAIHARTRGLIATLLS